MQKQRKSALGFFVLAGLFSAGVRAAEAPLTWEDCVRIAGQRNPDLLSARKSLESQRARTLGSYNGLMPQVTLSNSRTESGPASLGRTGGPQWQAQGSAGMDLFNLKNYADIGSASANQAQVSAQLRLESAALRFSLRQAFADFLLAQEQVTVSSKIMEIRKTNARTVSLRYASGRESKGNKMKAEAELFQAEAELAQAVRSLRSTRVELNRQLGRDDFAVTAATGTLETAALPPPPDGDSLLAGHPQIASFEAAEAVARAGVKSAWGQVFPNLSLNYSRSFVDSKEFPTANAQWSASGVLSLPLFGGGPTASWYAVTAAKRNFEKTQEDLRSAKLQVRGALESSWAGLAGSIDQVEVQRRFLAAANQRNDEAAIRYSSGLMTFEEWELVVSDFVNFERGMVQSRRDAVVAEAAWRKALGKGLEEQ